LFNENGSSRRGLVPTILIEDVDTNCTVTVIVADIFEEMPEPNPPAEMPEDKELKSIWLVSKKDAS
jgi:hypothetical protein